MLIQSAAVREREVRYAMTKLVLKLSVIDILYLPANILRLRRFKLGICRHDLLSRRQGNSMLARTLKKLWTYVVEDSFEYLMEAEKLIEIAVSVESFAIKSVDRKQRGGWPAVQGLGKSSLSRMVCDMM